MDESADAAPQLADENPAERHAALRRAEYIARALDKPIGILGVAFVFVVLAQLLSTDEELSDVLTVIGWVFWAIFVVEFVLRAYIARFQRAFWKRNWWQVIFLLVPFLRLFGALQALRVFNLARVGRVGGVFSAGIRGTRSAGKLYSTRVAWLLAAITGRRRRGRHRADDPS
jgi:voltage-gated potassium channel